MQHGELIALIERTAPPRLAAAWDHSGLQVAAKRTEINRLAVCLDPTPDAIRSALDSGADMVLSHHPLALQPRFLDQPGPFLEAARLLLSADVSLYAAHTSLDANPHGPAAWLARELALCDTAVLEPTAEGYGMGLAGRLPEPLSGRELLGRLDPWLRGGHTVLAGPELPDTGIKVIALCPGSGGSLLKAAGAAGATVMITGDVTYHAALESPISVLDVGHFLLEEEMMRRFAAALSPALPVTFIPGRDPVRALPATP
jgi:dinuclear metal center YbgI/SA1388 family protein